MKPSVGRIVHFFEAATDEPHAALIVRVDDADKGVVTLCVFPRNGTPEGKNTHRVFLVPQTDATPNGYGRERGWAWPPRT